MDLSAKRVKVVAGEHSKYLYNCAYEILDQQKRQKYMTSFIQRRQLKYINFRNKHTHTQKKNLTRTHSLSRGRHADTQGDTHIKLYVIIYTCYDDVYSTTDINNTKGNNHKLT